MEGRALRGIGMGWAEHQRKQHRAPCHIQLVLRRQFGRTQPAQHTHCAHGLPTPGQSLRVNQPQSGYDRHLTLLGIGDALPPSASCAASIWA
jgi:hypothetical protein